jgi:sugar lactone lactonase YvrE
VAGGAQRVPEYGRSIIYGLVILAILFTYGRDKCMPESQSFVDIISEVPCELGESALWDADRARLYWVDITGQAIYARDWPSGAIASLAVPDPVGSVALRAGGGLVAALRHAVAFCDVDAGTLEVVRVLEDDLTGNRFNDGAVDPAGRFWFGSMDMAEAAATGTFYCLHQDTTVTAAFNGIICSNGPAWSPDGRTVYHVDSTRRLVRAYEFDPETGVVGPGRSFVSDEDHPWFPDGVTVDAEGYVWNCKWDGGRIVRYAPDGTLDREIPLPVPRPTRCAFVGPDLAQLAVTTARIGLSADQLRDAPLSGQVLLLDPGATGLPSPRFAG